MHTGEQVLGYAVHLGGALQRNTVSDSDTIVIGNSGCHSTHSSEGERFLRIDIDMLIYIAHYRTVPIMRSVHRVLLKQMSLK